MSDIKELAALTALNDMMDKGRFDICCVREVGKMLGVNAEAHDSYRVLSPLHMIHFGKMPQQLQDAIPKLVQDCLGMAPTFRFKTVKAEVIEVNEQPPSKGFLRLLGVSK
jgi:hypothetical protein